MANKLSTTLHSKALKGPIGELTFEARALLFAELSQLAYFSGPGSRRLGFTTEEFYDIDGAQSYRFMNKYDIVIACRGTQPTEFNDIKADLKAFPIKAETVSRVHRGFKTEVDKLWPKIEEDLAREADTRSVWFCGHSLGGAMATIVSSRCRGSNIVPDPKELHTFGSPRVGWGGYVNNHPFTHYRWVNNNDIVTRVPFWILGYKHHGTEKYFNTWGNLRKMSYWQRCKDRMRGMWRGLKAGKIDNFTDHSIADYAKHCANLRDGIEIKQI